MYYEIEIAGLRRKLPLCRVNDSLYIGAFIMFGDVEITKAAATELLKFKLRIPSRIGMRTQAEANRCITASSSPRLSRPNTR